MNPRVDRRAARRLFAYGTLMVPAVLRAVCGAERDGALAVLRGYARYRVRGQVFPGIVPASGRTTEGVVFDAINSRMWARIDDFESDFYARTPVIVETADGEQLAASTYVVRTRHRSALTARPWDPERFASEHLSAYLARYT